MFVDVPAEHGVQLVGRLRADHTANETACQRAHNSENAQIKPNSTATNVSAALGLLNLAFALTGATANNP